MKQEASRPGARARRARAPIVGEVRPRPGSERWVAEARWPARAAGASDVARCAAGGRGDRARRSRGPRSWVAGRAGGGTRVPRTRPGSLRGRRDARGNAAIPGTLRRATARGAVEWPNPPGSARWFRQRQGLHAATIAGAREPARPPPRGKDPDALPQDAGPRTRARSGPTRRPCKRPQPRTLRGTRGTCGYLDTPLRGRADCGGVRVHRSCGSDPRRPGRRGTAS
jgi:hypothetical protein